jgi:hypothetical protein
MGATRQLISTLKAIEQFLSSETGASYYVRAFIFAFLGFLFSNATQFLLVKVLVIGIGVANSFHCYKKARKIGLNFQRSSIGDLGEYRETIDAIAQLSFENERHNSRIINTAGGSYNENIEGNYIQGDYIEIQGYPVSINQDLSEFADQLKQIQIELQRQGGSKGRIASSIVSDLIRQVHDDPEFKEALFQWASQLGDFSQYSESSVVESVVGYALSSPQKFSGYSTLLKGGRHQKLSGLLQQGGWDRRYQKLFELLQEEEWFEADVETAKLIFELCNRALPCENSYFDFYSNRLCAQDVIHLSAKDLNIINALWLKSSNGYFGFSTQKQLWKQVRQEHEYYDDLETFGTAVGWRVDDAWIYYSDISYSSLIKLGHLPARVMMQHSWSGYTSCQPDRSLFEIFMDRIYIL